MGEASKDDIIARQNCTIPNLNGSEQRAGIPAKPLQRLVLDVLDSRVLNPDRKAYVFDAPNLQRTGKHIMDHSDCDHSDWRELCKAAMSELDPNKLIALVAEINVLLTPGHARRTKGPADDNAECGALKAEIPSPAFDR